MRKIAMVVALVAGMAMAAAAQDNRDSTDKKMLLGIGGGYSTLGMSQLNDYQTQLSQAGLGNGSVTKVENGYYLNGELLWESGKGLYLGPRVDYLMANTGKVSNLLGETKIDQSILPVMIGGRYMFKDVNEAGTGFYDKSGFNAGLFAGYGWAWAKSSVSSNLINTSADSTGGGFAADALVGWQYSLSRTVSFGVDLGYRYAPVSEMKYTEDKDALGIKKDDVVKDLNGKTVENDFSWLLLGVGLNFKM
jgi:hypothetical protein